MKKRKLMNIIIPAAFIIQFLLANFVFRNFPPVLSFALLVPFYLFVYVYFGKYKVIKYIAFVSIFTVMANVFLLSYMEIFPLYSNKIRLIGMVSYFGSIINLILAFILILSSEPKSKFLKGLFVFIVVTNYIFFSYYLIPFTGLLAAIFGPNEIDIELMLLVLQIVIYVLQFLIVLAQMIIIHKLDFQQEYEGKADNNQ